MKFVFRGSGNIKFWDSVEDSDTGGPSSVAFRIDWGFNNDIANFVLKIDEGEAESIALLIFVLWRWGRAKSYSASAKIASFSQPGF